MWEFSWLDFVRVLFGQQLVHEFDGHSASRRQGFLVVFSDLALRVFSLPLPWYSLRLKGMDVKECDTIDIFKTVHYSITYTLTSCESLYYFSSTVKRRFYN